MNILLSSLIFEVLSCEKAKALRKKERKKKKTVSNFLYDSAKFLFSKIKSLVE